MHKRLRGRLIGLLPILLCCLRPAPADTIATWAGGSGSCPNCWSLAGNWSPATVPNGAFSVTIGATANQPSLNTPASIDNLTLGSGASLQVLNGQALTINAANTGGTSSISNAGSLTLASTGAATDLALSGVNGIVNLGGGGTLSLSSNVNNRIYASSSGMTLNNTSTIQGAGQIGLIGNSFTFNNNAGGVLNANQSAGLSLDGNVSNAGLLEATNGATLTLTSATINNASGTLSASGAGSIIALSGTTINGGTLQTSGGGLFSQTGSYSTLTGTVALNGLLNVANGSGLNLNATAGPLTFNFGTAGALSLNAAGSVADLSLIGTNGTVNLNGPVTLSNSVNNRIYANSSGMTLNNNSTIQGAGQIGVVGSSMTINNTGTINANQTAGVSLNGIITNTSGLLEATNGGSLTLSGSINNTGSNIMATGTNTNLQLTGVSITNTGGTISLNGAGSIGTLNGATIAGGTLQAANGASFTQTGSYSTLSGTIALNGALNVANSSGLNLNAAVSPLTFNFGTAGALSLNAAGSVSDLALIGTNGTVNLNGPVTLSNNTNNRIYANSAGMTLNSSSTIQGAGQIGVVGSSLIVNNSGTINANQTAGLTLNGTVTNTSGLLEATNGGSLTLSGSVNNTGSNISATGANTSLQLTGVNITNTGGTISVNGAGSIVTLNGATIAGGTLQASNGGTFTQTGSYSTLAGTMALNGVLNVNNNSGLTLNTGGGAIALNFGIAGALNLNSAGNVSDLAFLGTNGTVNLNGPVTLSNNANNRIYANSAGMTLNNNSTIQGSGQIALIGSALTFGNSASGVVNSNQSAGLSLTGTVLNSGLLEATNGSTLSLTGATINNASGILSASGAGSIVALNGTSINGGTLQASGGGLFTQTGSSSTLSGTVALNGVLNVGNNNGLNLNANTGPMTLNFGTAGALNLNSTGNVTDLSLTGAAGTINLNGPVTLSNNVNNRIYANSTGMTLNNNSTIQGAGQIGVVGAPLNFINAGTLNSNQTAGLTLNGTITNTSGLLEATNGGTLILGGSINNTGSNITATGANTNLQLTGANITNANGTISLNGAGSLGTLNGATIAGGTLQATNGASFLQTGAFSTLSSAVTLNGVLNVNNNSGLTFNTAGGTMALNIGPGGGLNLNSTGNLTDLAIAGANGAVLLNGPVTLSNNANNRIYGSSAGMTLYNNSIIQGAGQIGVVGNPFTFNNNAAGVVNANQSTGLSVGGAIGNIGLLEATNGNTLTLTGATINNAGGTISASGAGSVVGLSGTSIANGTLQSSGGGQFSQTGGFSTLIGAVALNGTLNVNNNSALYLNAAGGPMTLNIGSGGGLNLNSTGNTTDLVLTASNGTVNLNGPVTLSDNANNRIYANNTGMTLNNSGTLTGAGQIGVVGVAVTFKNTGTIFANQSTALNIGANSFTNSGELQVAAGSTLNITSPTFTNFAGNTLTNGTYFDGGILEFTGANIVNNAATIVLDSVAAEIEDQTGNNALRSFNNNTGSGTFILERGSNFTGTSAFANSGNIDIFATSTLNLGINVFTQTGGLLDVDGVFTASEENIDGGELTGSGTVNGNVSVTTGATIIPGDTLGTLTINGNYTQTPAGIADILIGGNGSGQYDVLDITGSAALGGTLNIATLSGFTPFAGETFDIANYGSRSGAFSTVNGLNLGNGYTFSVTYNATDVVLTVNGTGSTPEPGTWMSFALGAVMIAAARRNRRKSAPASTGAGHLPTN